MSADGWTKKLLRCERGNVLLIGAAVMPMMIGAAALGLDTYQLGVWKRQLQRMADSSALAGGHAIIQGKPAREAVTRDLGYNNQVPLSAAPVIQNAPTSGPYSGDIRAVQVILTSQRALPFWSFFQNTSPTLRAEATSRVVQTGKFCMLSLYEGTDSGIDISGNANVNLGCGMATNAQGPKAIVAAGNSTVNVSSLIAVGGISGASNYVGSPTILPYSDKQSDPFAYLPNPTVPAACSPGLTATVGETVITTAGGCYSSISVGPQGTLTLAPGTYIVNGGDIDFKGTIRTSGTGGVTFVMTGPGGAAGDLRINSQAILKLEAPTSGTYKDILFYRDRRASDIKLTINGGSTSYMRGAFYFPTSEVTFSGNSDMILECFQVVAYQLKFRGTTDLTNKCPNGSNPGFAAAVVRLVG